MVHSSLHYQKIVQNEHYGYPQEWFPSVSATIGDRYPERSVFQVFIALTAGMILQVWCVCGGAKTPKQARGLRWSGFGTSLRQSPTRHCPSSLPVLEFSAL